MSTIEKASQLEQQTHDNLVKRILCVEEVNRELSDSLDSACNQLEFFMNAYQEANTNEHWDQLQSFRDVVLKCKGIIEK